MLPDGTYTGVVDRFEEDAEGTELAVILLEDGEEVVDQVDVARTALSDIIEQDSVVEVRIDGGDVVTVALDREETETRTGEAQSRFDRLARRPEDDANDSS